MRSGKDSTDRAAALEMLLDARQDADSDWPVVVIHATDSAGYPVRYLMRGPGINLRGPYPEEDFADKGE